jgi:geranylgeranyl pyrophosphate synthase
MSEDKFINNYNRLSDLFGGWLDEFSEAQESRGEVASAFTYSLQAGGKRLRPILSLLVAEALEIELTRLKPFCLALELLHTASLIHDDLPALDNDSLRRGKPTCHIEFGESTALLAGDALIGLAFSTLATADSNETPQSKLKLIELLGKTTADICEGQVMDLADSISLNALSRDSKSGGSEAISESSIGLVKLRHQKKTGALITASVIGPCYFLPENKAEKAFSYLTEFGNKLGLLFQITDDILGATSTTAQLGKTAELDNIRGRQTYASLLGLDQAKVLAEQTANDANSALENLEYDSTGLNDVCEFVLNRKN